MDTTEQTVDLVGDETVENVARAALFAALTGAFAYVVFPNPVSPTDITLQVLGVFLAGIFLGPVWGTVSMVLYLAAGSLGAPVFLGGAAGVGQLLGPTGGYLLSYPLAAGVIGLVVHGGATLRDPSAASLFRLVAALTLGTLVIYALGALGLMFFGDLGVRAAVVGGALVFLPAEALKAAAAVGIVRSDAIAAA
ncbi:biotin transporter BioY [Halomarina ordinaria]|uniref:Biotin transporter BioY n=1 Tax=Halomarina ordinaria TaxID=3033939 RepID=A0ABD5UGS4_9EURY|nr:biotin transporter BioY [Halomarina sp. PSRA2]